MRSLLAATIVVFIPVTLSAQSPVDERVCTADQAGDVLVTTVEYEGGYRVEAPWRITAERKHGGGQTRMTVVLDHIVETQPETRKRQLTHLPTAVQMTFSGSSNTEVLRAAAKIWCSTVDKALAARSSNSFGRVAAGQRVIM